MSDSFRIEWEVIQTAEEGKQEINYRWFRTSKDAENWYLKRNMIDTDPAASQNIYLLPNPKHKLP